MDSSGIGLYSFHPRTVHRATRTVYVFRHWSQQNFRLLRRAVPVGTSHLQQENGGTDTTFMHPEEICARLILDYTPTRHRKQMLAALLRHACTAREIVTSATLQRQFGCPISPASEHAARQEL